jgi:large subunit ribosomal protein L23
MKNKIIIKPIITEKTLSLVEDNNQYTFSVRYGNNKIDIKEAVQDRFGVKVNKVRVMNLLGKRVMFGRKRIPGWKSDIRKAIVTLKEGDTINDFNIK